MTRNLFSIVHWLTVCCLCDKVSNPKSVLKCLLSLLLVSSWKPVSVKLKSAQKHNNYFFIWHRRAQSLEPFGSADGVFVASMMLYVSLLASSSGILKAVKWMLFSNYVLSGMKCSLWWSRSMIPSRSTLLSMDHRKLSTDETLGAHENN